MHDHQYFIKKIDTSNSEKVTINNFDQLIELIKI